MGIFRKMAEIFGFGKDQLSNGGEEQEEEDPNQGGTDFRRTGLPRKGFGVPVAVSVEPSNPGTVIEPSSSGDGGVQGLRWYAKHLRIDEDGDAAHEFIEEVLPKASSLTEGEGHKRQIPKFQLHYSTQPAKVKEQMVAFGGRIQHCVENQGRLQWV
ncbi:hypothetical protein SAY86_020186 [Trapa natans]|uniref:Uncharacterized protein n=1 Tax=Trapa natans TaxID=22666 RepID=A0AAN7R3Y9_TRANT|nr:hypothetical protein SAY86_020186 [Trapa natans]